jgi:biotin-dependent carboxylase-like uncharacterized protein
MIEILRSAPLTSVQDQGRSGLRHLGVCNAGALDPLAAKQANLLVGNDPEDAVLEVTLGPFEIQFLVNRLAAICGTDFDASIDTPAARGVTAKSRALIPGFAQAIRAGERLRLMPPASGGGRAYIAIAGGINVPTVLGSRSTDLNAGFGGFAGRSLRRSDKISLGPLTPAQERPQDSIEQDDSVLGTTRGLRSLRPRPQLRALEGVDSALFDAEVLDNFWHQDWRVDARSNRMGIRLQGRAYGTDFTPSLLSSGVLPGDVQLPGDGQPIVLASDAQTTGGYPRIAHIIQADLWQLAHLRPNSGISFKRVTLETAHAANAKMDTYWERVVLWRNLVQAQHDY